MEFTPNGLDNTICPAMEILLIVQFGRIKNFLIWIFGMNDKIRITRMPDEMNVHEIECSFGSIKI